MGLEKVGLPYKPSEKGKNWTPDATNCEFCHAAFSLWNRKHHCRRCGGLFCNNCTLQRQVLRGQGDTPVRICDPCKKLDEASRFELRYGKNKTPRGGSKATSKDDDIDSVLRQPQELDGKSSVGDLNLESILASVADTDIDEPELGSPSQVKYDGDKRANRKHECQDSADAFDRIGGQDSEPISPEKLHEQAQEEKQKYTALRKQGKDAEAMKAFKRAKELDRQSEALAKEIRTRRRASVGSISPLSYQQSKVISNKTGPASPDADLNSLGRRKSEPSGENLKKSRASLQEQSKETRIPTKEDDFLQDLKELGWTDKEIREAGKKPVVKTDEQLLAELAAESRPKSDRVATSATSGQESAMSMQILAHKRQALTLKREGKMAEAKEELKKAKILEKQVEEMALLGETDEEGEASDDDELHALIRGLDREEKLKGNAGKGSASQSIPEEFGFLPNFGDDEDDAHVEVDDADLDDPDMVAALRAMGWEEEAAGMERTHKLKPKVARPSQSAVPTLKEQVLGHKRKALALKREGKIAEARAELSEAKKLEQDLEKLESVATATNVIQAPDPTFDVGDGKVDEGEEVVEVTDNDMQDPEMMAALRAMGFAEDEPTPIHKTIMEVTKPNPVEKATLQQEILMLKRHALAMKREGQLAEAREELRHAKVLEQQLEDLQAAFQPQEEASAMIKESRAVRRGTQALPALSGVPNFDDQGEEEDEDVTNDDLMDPDIAAALAAVGWQESTEDTPTEESQPQTTDSKDKRPDPNSSVMNNLGVATSVSLPLKKQHEESGIQGTNLKAQELISGLSVTDNLMVASSGSVPEERQSQKANSEYMAPIQHKTKSQLQQELLGRKRRALALKREGKSQDALLELREAKIIEQQMEDLEKGPVSSPSAPIVKPKPSVAAATANPLVSIEDSFKQETEAARPIYLDDEPIEDVTVTEDDEQDPDILAALAGVGWPGELEATSSTKPNPPADKISTSLAQDLAQFTPQTAERSGQKSKTPIAKVQIGKQEVNMESLLDFDWGNPSHRKKTGKDVGTKNEKASKKSGNEDEEENPFEGEYGEIGQIVDLTSPLLGNAGPKDPAEPLKQRHYWNAGFMDLLSGDKYSIDQNKEPVEKIEPAAVEVLGKVSSQKNAVTVKGSSQLQSNHVLLPPPPPVTQLKPKEPTGAPSSRGEGGLLPEKSNLQQEILALKHKALGLKREGKTREALEELRKVKLLERQIEQQGSTSAPRTGRDILPALNKVEVVTTVAPSTLKPMNTVKASPPTKGPAHKEQMQQEIRQKKDRMKLQQESLAHKRKAMGLRREGKIDEADAEYELAKTLEKQMEDLDPMHGKEELGDVPGVEDFLDPQLLAALKGVGFKEGELAGGSEPKGTVKLAAQPPSSNRGSSSRSSTGGPGTPMMPIGKGTEEEKRQLEEQIRGQKLQAVQLKRAGNNTEALDILRGAKRLEKQLLALNT